MRPPDKEYGKSEVGVWWVGRCGIRSRLCLLEIHEFEPQSPALFKVDQTFLTASRMKGL